MSGARERWRQRREDHADHPYGGACDFAERVLGKGEGRACLVAGSPRFEVEMLTANGWDVTVVDVRKPPWPCKHIQLDALDLDQLPEESFDAISSTCLLTHVGTGRYGDRIQVDGDIVALGHMYRRLKPGAVAAMQIGGVIAGDEMVTVGACHRLYTVAEGERMVREAGFEILERAIWSFDAPHWRTDTKGMKPEIRKEGYLCFALRKPC